MLCLVLLPKIQPLSKTGNPDTATTLLREKLLHFMLGGNGRFSTTFCAITAAVIFAGEFVILSASRSVYRRRL